MKKVLSALLVLVMSTSLLAGCGASKASAPADSSKPAATTEATKSAPAAKKFKVGFTNLADTDMFLKYSKDIFLNLAKADPNIEVIAMDANGDLQKQLDHIDNFIAQKVDAIMVCPVDYQGVVPGVKKANAAGIPVIAFIIKAAEGKSTFIGSYSVDAGIMQGELMKEKLPQNAKILYLQGTPGLYHSAERWNGFKQACLDKRPDIKVLASLPADYDRNKGMQITEDWIQSFPQFDAIIAANDQMALGAVQALKGANRLNGVMVSGIDATYDACVAIDKGEMTQSIFQNGGAQAKKAFEVIQDMMKGKMPTEENLFIPYSSITKETVKSLLDDYVKQGYGKK